MRGPRPRQCDFAGEPALPCGGRGQRPAGCLGVGWEKILLHGFIQCLADVG